MKLDVKPGCRKAWQSNVGGRSTGGKNLHPPLALWWTHQTRMPGNHGGLHTGKYM